MKAEWTVVDAGQDSGTTKFSDGTIATWSGGNGSDTTYHRPDGTTESIPVAIDESDYMKLMSEGNYGQEFQVDSDEGPTTHKMAARDWNDVQTLAFTDGHDELGDAIEAANLRGYRAGDTVEIELDPKWDKLVIEYHLDEEGRMATTNYLTNNPEWGDDGDE